MYYYTVDTTKWDRVHGNLLENSIDNELTTDDEQTARNNWLMRLHSQRGVIVWSWHNLSEIIQEVVWVDAGHGQVYRIALCKLTK